MHESELLVRKVLEAGAHGCVLKTALATNIKAAIRAVSQGSRYLSCRMTEALLDNDTRHSASGRDVLRLTGREQEVVRFLSVGKSNKEIASELGISVRTVETHRANIMRKLNLHSVTELLHYVFSKNLISSGAEISL
jgi:DNA-binding NarL/FixJ family response regulator